MFAFKNELSSIVRKDPLATDAEKKRVLMAVECRADRCVRFDDAAERLGVCKAILYRLVREGKLVGVRLTGRRPYGITEESLENFIKESRINEKEIQ